MTTTATVQPITQRIWERMEPIYQQVLELPFLRELQAGTLDRAIFARFVIQDALYLEDYGRALSLVGVRLGDQDALNFFANATTRVIAVERDMHAGFLKDLGISPDEIANAEQLPAVSGYTSWVKQACGMGQPHEAVASVLSCFWIYREVGQELARRGGSPDPLYQSWIDKYSGDAFDASTNGAIAIVDRVGARVSPEEQEQMIRTAHTATRYEWLLWTGVYENQQWPV